MFTFLTGFRQNRYSWHTYFIVYFPDWVQTKSILLTHILYCLLSWLGSDKIDTLDTHTLLFILLTGFRQNRYSWHTYFIVYSPDWVQTKSIFLTHILYCLLSWLGSDKIDTLDTHTLLFTLLTGFRQNRYSWHTYFIVYFPDWVQTKSILLTHILYCLLSWLGSDKIDTLDTHTLLYTFLTGFRQNRYSWHTYFIVYFPDWFQTKSILLTHILYCLLSWLGSDKFDTLDTHTLLFTFLTGFRQNRYSWHTYFIVYFPDWVQTNSILLTHILYCLLSCLGSDKIDTLDTHTLLFTFLTGFRQNRYSWHAYFIVYSPDWVQKKSILLTHILYCLLSWLGSDKIDTLDTHTLLFTFLTGFRQIRYSWHTYFIVYFPDWVQTKSILLTYILYCLLSWLGSDIIDTLDTHTLLFTFLTGFRQNQYSWHTYFIVYFPDWVQTKSILLTHILYCLLSWLGSDKIDTLDTHTLLFILLTGFRQNRYSWHTYFIVYSPDWVQTKSIFLTHILYCLLSWLGSDKIDTLDTHTLLFTLLTGFRQNRYSWHTYFIVYFPDWVQTKSILLTHILYCLLSWLGSDKIDTLDTHTLLFTFLTGFRQNRYSWHTYFIVYFPDWFQTKSILLTHILYCLLSWLGSDKFDTLDTHTLLFTFLTGFRQNRYSWHTYFIVYFPDWVQTNSILLTHILYCLLSCLGSDKIDTLDTHTLLFTFLTGFRQNRYSWHAYFIVYSPDWVQKKSILLTHILYCLLSWLGSDKIDTLDTHTLLFTFLTGFRQIRYSWHTYFIVYFPDWVQTKSILLTHILYCLLSWLGSDKFDTLDTHTLLFTFLTGFRQNRYSWHTYFIVYSPDWVQTKSILLTHILYCLLSWLGSDKIDTLDTYTLLFTLLTGFRQNRYSWHTYFIDYFLDWVQTKSILLTHILYCLLSWLGSDKIDTLDTHTLLFTFLTGFRQNRYSWHTYFIVYFLDWVQTKSILLTHILYCLLSWLGSDIIDTLDTHTLLFTFLTGFRQNRYSWHTYFIVYFFDWVQIKSILLTHTLFFTFLTGFRQNRYSWHTYFIVYFPDWVQTKSILLTHILYCLLSWLGSDKIDTLDTHTLLFTFLTGFRQNRYSWHTYFIVYFLDWVQT